MPPPVPPTNSRPGGVAPAGPVPPPVLALPFGRVGQGGQVYLSTVGINFLQTLWAAIQGAGGIIDLNTLNLATPGQIGAAVESQLNQDTTQAGVSSQALGQDAALRAVMPPPPFLLPGIDYRETSPSPVAWKPTLAGSGTAGAQTYGTQFGWACDVGPLTIATFDVVLTALDGATAGDVLLQGLPLPAALSAPAQGAVIATFDGITLGAGLIELGAVIAGGESQLRLFGSASAVARAPLDAAGLSATTAITGMVAYFR